MPLPWGRLDLFIGKGPGPLPKYLSGKGANNWPIRRGTSGTLILTKVGLRLPKALWWRRPGLHGDLLPSVGLVFVLLHRNGCLCLILSPALAPFAPKRKGRRYAGWRPSGALGRHGLRHGHLVRYPTLISPPPREPARLRKLCVVRPARLGPSRGSSVYVEEDGPCWAPFEPRHRPQAGKSGDPRSQNADSSPPAQGAPRLGRAERRKGKGEAPQALTACGLGRRVAVDWMRVLQQPRRLI